MHSEKDQPYEESEKAVHSEDPVKLEISSGGVLSNYLRGMRFENRCHRQNFIQTACVYLNFILLGWNYGQLGTAFQDLQLVLNTNVKQTSLIFTMNSVGYMLGSICFGFIYDRMDKLLLLGVVSIVSAVASAVIPWCTSYGPFLALRLATGFLCGGLDSGGNAKVASCWNSDTARYIQALHFSYAFGGIISPLVTTLFMAPRTLVSMAKNQTQNTTYLNEDGIKHASLMVTNLLVAPRTLVSKAQNQTKNETFIYDDSDIYQTLSVTTDGIEISTIAIQDEVMEVYGETKIHIAFIITGILTAIAGCFYLLLYWLGYEKVRPFTRGNQLKGDKGDKYDSSGNKIYPIMSNRDASIFIIVLATSVIFFSAVECKFQSFLMPFMLMQMHWRKKQIAFLISLLWALYGFGRFLGITISRFLSPFSIIVISMLSTLALSCAMLIGTLFRIDTLMWIVVSSSGLSMSIIFPSFMVWTDGNVRPITGKMAGYFLFIGGLGFLIDPLYVGILMENVSPLWFVYLQIGEISCSLVIYVLLVLWVKKLNKREDKNSAGSSNYKMAKI